MKIAHYYNRTTSPPASANSNEPDTMASNLGTGTPQESTAMTNPLAFSPPASRESCGGHGDGGGITVDKIGDGQQPPEGTAPSSTTEPGMDPAATQQAPAEADSITAGTRSPVVQSDEGQQPDGGEGVSGSVSSVGGSGSGGSSTGGNGSAGCNSVGSSGGRSGGSRSGRSGGGSRQSGRSNRTSPRGSVNSVHNDTPLWPSSENTTGNRRQRPSVCPPSSSSAKSQQDGSRGVTVGDDWCVGGKSNDGVAVPEDKAKRPGGISDAAAQRQRQAAAREDERRIELTRQWTRALGALCSPAHKDLWPQMIDAGILGALYRYARRRSINIYIRACIQHISHLVVFPEFSCCVTTEPVLHDCDN